MSDRLGPFDPDRPDDETARRLRDVLAQEARSIKPSPDGLTMIRQKIRAQRGARTWMRAFQIGGAGLATAAVAVVTIVLAENRPSSSDHAVLPGAPSTLSPSPSGSPTTVASSAPATRAVAVYFVGKRKDPDQLLFRETTMWPVSPEHTVIKDAVSAMLATPPQDPDYQSFWPTGTRLLSANISGTTAVIDLSGEAANNLNGEATISVQQLLYTIKAAAPKIDGLQLKINGVPQTSLWGSPLDPTVKALPDWQAENHVWITSPLENQATGSSITITGEAGVFEGTVHWQLLLNGAVIKDDFTMGGGVPRAGWSVKVDGLAPGAYLVRAYEVSMKDGSVTNLDDKDFTVQ